MRRTITLSLVILVSFTTLATCGQDSSAPPITLEGDVNDRGTVVVSDSVVTIELGDFYYEPTFVQAEPGARVEVRLHNAASSQHTFTVEALGLDEVLAPGAESVLDVTLPEDGSVVVFSCRFHPVQGMQGAFFSVTRAT